MKTLSEQVADLEAQIAELKKQNEFSIDYNDWYVGYDGEVISGLSRTTDTIAFFGYFKTKEIAERVSKQHRMNNLIANFASFYDDGKWETDWNDHEQKKCLIYYDYTDSIWRQNSSHSADYQITFMSEGTAHKLVKYLNINAPKGDIQ